MAIHLPKVKPLPKKAEPEETPWSLEWTEEQKSPKKKPFLPVRLGIGVGLLLVILGGIVFVARIGKEKLFSRGGDDDGEAFYRELAEFDALLVKTESFEKPETLNRRLDKLERKTLGAESRLSILKRRRLLARQDPRFIHPYQKSAQEAAEALPFSEPLAAVAVESLCMGEPALGEDAGERVRIYASRLSEPLFQPLALGAYLLLGDLQNPAEASGIANKEALFSAPIPEAGIGNGIPSNLNLAVDLLLLRILHGDIPGASAQIAKLLRNPGLKTAYPDLPRLAAEFFYDYESPLRGAELFSQFSDERSMARQADALWRGGHSSGARNVWRLLLAPKQSAGTDPEFSPAIKARSLYNLAATTEDPREKAANLRDFLTQGPALLDGFGAPAPQEPSFFLYTCGTLSYTRLLDTPQSVAILEQGPSGSLLLDLELLRRRRELWTVDKGAAETWILVNRYAEDPRIYQWGCYFFDLQRRYDETAELMEHARYQGIRGPWMEFHESLQLLRKGGLEEGEKRLTGIDPPNFIWQIPANRARILEIRREWEGALEYYETAAALVKNKKSAAKIRFRMSRCLQALGRGQESRQALEQALEYDPDYLNARLELQRQ